jgi:hypothetical protein
VHQSGTESIGNSNIGVPSESILVIDAANASDQQTWHEYQNPKQPASESVTLDFRPNGVFVQAITFQYTLSGLTTTFPACKFSQQLAAPLSPIAVGQAYTGAAACGDFTLQANAVVSAQNQVTLDGSTYPAFVITTTIITHGALDSSDTEVEWYSPELRLPLHMEIHAHGSYGPIAFTTNIVGDLESTGPSNG